MIKIVYFGKKRPKVFKTVSPEMFEYARAEGRSKGDGITYIPLAGKSLRYSFEPFKSIEVDDSVGKVLLDGAGDMFKRVDDTSPKRKPIIKTDGYVGDVHAENIKDLPKKVSKENKAEEGKSAEQIVGEYKDK